MSRKKNSVCAILMLAVLGAATLLGLLRSHAFASAAVRGAEAETNPSPFVTSYPLPDNEQGSPGYLLQAEGKLWFTAPGNNAIGALELGANGTYTYTFFDIHTPDSTPYDLTWDGQNIWFTELTGNKLGKLHVASEAITEYDLPTPDSEPTGIAWDSGGTIWFVERAGNKLTAFDPVTETFTPYPYREAGALPEDVATYAGRDWVWFTAPGAKRLVLFNNGTKQFFSIPTSAPFVTPYTPSQVAVDGQGNPWVSTLDGRIGRYAATTNQFFRWYQVAPEDSNIDGLNWAPDGSNNQLIFTESNTGYAGRLKTTASGRTRDIWRFPVAPADARLTGLVAEPNGAIWLADGKYHQLLRWAPPYFYSTYLSVIVRPD